jgi:hypothetical protein
MAENKTTSLLFHVYRGSSLIKTVELSEESVTIGSGPAALLSIEDKSLADLHAVVNVEANGQVQLFDLGSEAGTKLNGAAISNSPLKDGDAIEVGNLRIVVAIRQGAGASADEFDEEEATHVQSSPLDNAPAESGVLAGQNEEEATDPGLGASPAPAPKRTAPAAEAAPAHAAPAQAEAAHAEGGEEHDDHDDHEAPDDVIGILMRSPQADPKAKNRAKVLEVSQVWGDALVDTKRFKHGRSASIGSSVVYKWSVFNVPLLNVPPPMNMVMQFVPPLGGDCQSDWQSDFYAPESTLPSGRDYDLIKWTGGQYVARVASKWDGFVDIGDKRYSFAELEAEGKARKQGDGYEIPMTDDTRVAIDTDGMVFFAQMVHPGSKAIAKFGQNIDYLFLTIASAAVMLLVIFGVIVYVTPSPPKNEIVELDDRYVELLMEKPEPEKKKGGNPDAGEGAKAKKEEGKVGKKDAKMEKAKGDKVKMQKQEIDRQVVEQAGVMGALSDDSLSQTLGASGLSADITGGIGGLIGAKGTQIGSGGLGARGSGLGGGGTAEGLGGLGTKGIGSGASGYGSGGGNFGSKGEGGIGTVGGDPIILGALDRSLIDEVIKRHMNQIRYCYQRELTKNNALAGKIVIKFVIAKDGTVSSASTKSTTMNNSAVESCIEGRFMRMQFPQPKGGGIVIVSYPFLFSPG